MLQHMRDNSKGVISGILIGLLVIIFAVSGAEALFKWDAAEKKAIKVNGQAITEADIARGVQGRKQEIIARYGESVPPEYLTDEKLRQPVIDGLIQRALLAQVAEKGGFAASTSVIQRDIVSAPAFQKDGVFNQDMFLQRLRYQGFTPATYQKAVAEDKVIGQMQSAIAESAFVTPAEMKNIIGLTFQTRDLSYLVIPAEKVSNSLTINDDEIKAYYDAHPQAYTTPEQVAVDYIDLNAADLANAVNVTDEQVQKQFEQNTKAFVAKTERQAAHILLDGADAQKRAEEVKAKLVAGEDFAKLAKEYSTDQGSKDQGGDLGFSSGDAFPAEFEAALAKLKVGEISAPVKTEAGVHIIKLIAERGSQPPSYEEAKPGIIDQLKRSEAESQFAGKLEKLKDLTYNADKLADAAKELGLTAQNTGFFSKTGGKDLTANNAFVSAAFSPEVLEQGNASDVIELAPSRVVVLKKTERKSAQLQPLESVKDQVVVVVRAEKTQKLLAQQSKEIIATINAGKTLGDAAKDAGLELKVANNLGRNAKDISRDLLEYGFSLAMPVNGKPVVGATKTTQGDYAVVALTSVHLANDDAVPAEQRTMIATQLANIDGGSEFKSYLSHLEEVAKIKRQ